MSGCLLPINFPRTCPPPFEILLSRFGLGRDASRLSSDWESTRLKIELSPVQIREAAYSETATTNGASGPSKKRRRPRFEPGESQARNGERSEPQARNVSTQFKSGRASGPFHAVPHAVVERSRTRR